MRLFFTCYVASCSRKLVSHTRSLAISSIIDHSSKKRVAVIGGGMAGLAVTKELYRVGEGNVQVKIFDPSLNAGESQGASSVAAGLFHPISPRGKMMWRGEESMSATLRLINEAQLALETEERGEKIISSSTVIQTVLSGLPNGRFHPSEEIRISQSRLEDEMNGYIPHRFAGGFILNQGYVVNTIEYLKGLWTSCSKLGASWEPIKVGSLSQLESDFDHIIVTAGAGIRFIPELREFCVSEAVFFSRGQCLQIPNYGGLKCALANRGEYIAPLSTKQLVIGATHEQVSFLDDEKAIIDKGNDQRSSILDRAPLPPQQLYDQYLKPAYHLWPKIFSHQDNKGPHFIDEKTLPPEAKTLFGVRVTSRRCQLGSLPIAGKVRLDLDHLMCWLLTGLGSRGLLYHGFLAQCLAKAVVSGDEGAIPKEFRPKDLHKR